MAASSLTAGADADSLFTIPERSRRLHAAFEQFRSGLHRFLAVRVGADVHLVEDLLQQVWLLAAQSRRDMPDEQWEPWLLTIARNLVRAWWRRQAGRPAHVPVADPALAAELAARLETGPLPPEVLERRELCDQLLLAITELRSAEQELIVGHYFEDRPATELATRLGISPRAAEGRLYRARCALREKLRDLQP